jgi:hypothetical protein
MATYQTPGQTAPASRGTATGIATPKELKEENWNQWKFASYLVTAVSFIPEFMQIGYYHELFRAAKYYNNNVNSPLVGNSIVCLLSIFYFARSIGGVVSLIFCEQKKII